MNLIVRLPCWEAILLDVKPHQQSWGLTQVFCVECVLKPLYQGKDGKATRAGVFFQKINEVCWVLKKGC